MHAADEVQSRDHYGRNGRGNAAARRIREKHHAYLAYISISDSIIITAGEGQELGFVRKNAQAQTALLKQGFAVRGAISYGTVPTYNGKMGRNIFGKTYLNAYQAEQALAVYPRVALESEEAANKVWEDIKEETDRSASTSISRDKSDGIWFVNQFSSKVIGRNSKTPEKPYQGRSGAQGVRCESQDGSRGHRRRTPGPYEVALAATPTTRQASSGRSAVNWEQLKKRCRLLGEAGPAGLPS